jgi:hypothetical protein
MGKDSASALKRTALKIVRESMNSPFRESALGTFSRSVS